MTLTRIFDGHNDSVHHIVVSQNGCAFLDGDGPGHIDLPRAKAGGFAGGFFAMFTPSPRRTDGATPVEGDAGYEVPYALSVEPAYAIRFQMGQMAKLFAVEGASAGRFRVVRSAAGMRDAFAAESLACILHFEGAEAIDRDFNALHTFHTAGLRSLGLVWSRENRFAFGVPFRYPHSPDTGPGLTDDGKRLVRACNELRVLVDLAHLNEAGFWDVAASSQAPLVATHSNAHALCPSTRNLTDRQLDAIRDSGGVVGVNFAVNFLCAHRSRNADAPLSVIADQFDYLVERMGIDHVAFGSDFDGCRVPSELADVTGLPKLVDMLRARGHDDESLEKLGTGNWMRVLETTWAA